MEKICTFRRPIVSMHRARPDALKPTQARFLHAIRGTIKRLEWDASPPRPKISTETTLPNEIMALIFETGQEQQPSIFTPTACATKSASSLEPAYTFTPRVSSVNRRWRAIALSLPCLWTTIDISFDRFTLPSLKDLLTRSADHPLRIRLTWSQRVSLKLIDEFMDLLNNDQHRIETLTICCHSRLGNWGGPDYSSYHILSRLRRMLLPNLQQFQSCLLPIGYEEVTSTFNLTDRAAHSKLSSLVLAGMGWDSLWPTHSSTFRDMLLACPALEKLILVQCDFPTLELNTCTHLPNLRTLHLSALRPKTTPAVCLALSTPNLHTLILNDTRDMSWDSFLSIFSNAATKKARYPRLASLDLTVWLERVGFQGCDRVQEFLSATPCMTAFSTEGSYEHILQTLIDRGRTTLASSSSEGEGDCYHDGDGDRGSGVLWPHLRSLTIRGKLCLQDELERFVRAREVAGGGFPPIRLDVRTRGPSESRLVMHRRVGDENLECGREKADEDEDEGQEDCSPGAEWGWDPDTDLDMGMDTDTDTDESGSGLGMVFGNGYESDTSPASEGGGEDDPLSTGSDSDVDEVYEDALEVQ